MIYGHTILIQLKIMIRSTLCNFYTTNDYDYILPVFNTIFL